MLMDLWTVDSQPFERIVLRVIRTDNVRGSFQTSKTLGVGFNSFGIIEVLRLAFSTAALLSRAPAVW
jgi:hypothetical protein